MFIGIDLGSRTIKVAAVEDGRLVDHQVAESGFDPQRQSLELIRKYHSTRIVATGYGRHLARKHFAEDVITEIKAHALGARYFVPTARTVLDVGGQDSKVISLAPEGKVANFQMNDKCAAGTGRFLEIMAVSLGYSLPEFGPAALKAGDTPPISSMCTVFAESEVISLKNQGAAPDGIARSVHLSVAQRLLGMLQRIGVMEDVVFTGGVANNSCMVTLLEEHLGMKLSLPDIPEITGALGAALTAEAMEGINKEALV